MERTKQTILIVNREVSQEALKTIADDFRSNRDICMTGYGIEIWEKDLVTGELKLLRADNENIVKMERIKFGELEIERPVEDLVKEKEVSAHPYHPYKKRPSIFSKEADAIITINYETNIDNELVKIIMNELNEEYTYDQVKHRRKNLGFFKERIQSNFPKTIYSKEVDQIMKNNYQENSDKQIAEIIKQDTGEDFSTDQIKSRRGYLGYVSHRRIKSKKYNEEHFNWMRENINSMTNFELTNEFNDKFGLEVSVEALQAQLHYNKILRQKKIEDSPETIPEETPHNLEEIKIDEKEESHESKKRKGMSEKAVEIIEENYMEKTDGELREMIADEANVFYPTDKIATYRESNGMVRPEGWSPEDFGLGMEEEDIED